MEERNILAKKRDDRIYIEELLGQIESDPLRGRLANEVLSYVYGAKKYRFLYFLLYGLSLLAPAVILLLNTYSDLERGETAFWISCFSVVASISTGMLTGTKAYNSWLRYRKFAEISKNEIFKCVMKLGEYEKAGDPEHLLAGKMEEIFAYEQVEWQIDRREDRKEEPVNGNKG